MAFGRATARLVWRAVRAACVLFTAIVVLFVLINLFAAYRYPRDTRAVLEGHPVFIESMRTLYERIYQLPIAVVREVVAECWMENAWIFEPYVQFRERPRQGRFVNISTDGFRLNGGTDRRTFDASRSASVFILGGSTTFGYGVRDEDTIAAHLAALLKRDDPQAAVYNFGRGYYGTSQEFLLLKSLVQRGMVPRTVVFIDGVNEHFCPTFSANIAEVFKIVQDDPGAKLREVIASLPVTRLASSVYRSELATNAIYINSALRRYAFECGCLQEATCHAQLLRTYLLNKQLVRTMAKEHGFEAHFVLQPVGGYRNRFTTSPEGTKRHDYSPLWREYERVSGENDHSLAGILEDYQDEAFVDLLHYTSRVNRLIAERIYPSVARALTRKEATTPTGPGAAPASVERVETEVHVAADPATVFSYFTDPEKLVRWMGRSARLRPVRDGEFHVQMSQDTWIRGTFVVLDPPRRLGLAWRWERQPAPVLPETTRVDIAFTPREGGVLVRLVHTGVPSLAAQGYRDGWVHYLARLSMAAAGRDPGPDTWFTKAEAEARRAR
jgi:uncharacterized protein YndB with AHSA1/START domain